MQLHFHSEYEQKADASTTSFKKLDDGPPVSKWAENAVESDKELFIRKTFDSSPPKGCELLFRLYYSALCSYAVQFVYSKAIAEDLVSDTFYTFWKNQSYLSVKSSYRAYLFKSVQNRCYNFLATELKNVDSLDLIHEYDFPSPELPERLMYFEELSQKINKIVQDLPSQCQKVFILNRFENKTNHEIASELNLSSRTVETHMSRALKILREGLKEYLILPVSLVTLTQFFIQY